MMGPKKKENYTDLASTSFRGIFEHSVIVCFLSMLLCGGSLACNNRFF